MHNIKKEGNTSQYQRSISLQCLIIYGKGFLCACLVHVIFAVLINAKYAQVNSIDTNVAKWHYILLCLHTYFFSYGMALKWCHNEKVVKEILLVPFFLGSFSSQFYLMCNYVFNLNLDPSMSIIHYVYMIFVWSGILFFSVYIGYSLSLFLGHYLFCKNKDEENDDDYSDSD
jgi:hypothetical protein